MVGVSNTLVPRQSLASYRTVQAVFDVFTAELSRRITIDARRVISVGIVMVGE